jgi:hypothetical protein
MRLDTARKDLEKQLKNSEDSRATLERALKEAELKPGPENGAMPGEVVRMKLELEKAGQENKRLEDQLAEVRGSASSPANSQAVDELRRQYEEQIQEMMRENVQLMEMLKGAESRLEVAGNSPVPQNGPVSQTGPARPPDSSLMDAEVARVGSLITEIAKIIDDPDTELSTVIRKNVERAELDAYLKGILFSQGSGKAL